MKAVLYLMRHATADVRTSLVDEADRCLNEKGRLQARRVAGHARLHCTHADGSSLVALVGELGELGSSDHNPERHPPPRNASIGITPKTPEIRPTQGSILIVVSAQL